MKALFPTTFSIPMERIRRLPHGTMTLLSRLSLSRVFGPSLRLIGVEAHNAIMV
jgi:hypothetical protein